MSEEEQHLPYGLEHIHTQEDSEFIKYAEAAVGHGECENQWDDNIAFILIGLNSLLIGVSVGLLVWLAFK
jgi:hypothetical protein